MIFAMMSSRKEWSRHPSPQIGQVQAKDDPAECNSRTASCYRGDALNGPGIPLSWPQRPRGRTTTGVLHRSSPAGGHHEQATSAPASSQLTGNVPIETMTKTSWPLSTREFMKRSLVRNCLRPGGTSTGTRLSPPDQRPESGTALMRCPMYPKTVSSPMTNTKPPKPHSVPFR